MNLFPIYGTMCWYPKCSNLLSTLWNELFLEWFCTSSSRAEKERERERWEWWFFNWIRRGNELNGWSERRIWDGKLQGKWFMDRDTLLWSHLSFSLSLSRWSIVELEWRWMNDLGQIMAISNPHVTMTSVGLINNIRFFQISASASLISQLTKHGHKNLRLPSTFSHDPVISSKKCTKGMDQKDSDTTFGKEDLPDDLSVHHVSNISTKQEERERKGFIFLPGSLTSPIWVPLLQMKYNNKFYWVDRDIDGVWARIWLPSGECCYRSNEEEWRLLFRQTQKGSVWTFGISWNKQGRWTNHILHSDSKDMVSKGKNRL